MHAIYTFSFSPDKFIYPSDFNGAGDDMKWFVMMLLLVLALGCSKNDYAQSVTGTAIKDIPPAAEPANQVASPETAAPVQTLCDGDIQAKIDAAEARKAEYDAELQTLNAKSLAALQSGDMDDVRALQYDLRKYQKLSDRETNNIAALTEQCG